MAKLNKTAKAEDSRLREHPEATVNDEGGLAFKMDSLSELYSRVLTSLVGEKQFYDDSGKVKDEAIIGLIGKVAKEAPEFILQLASWARNDAYLRSIPQVLLVEATKYPETKAFVRKWATSIIQRADEITEVGAYYKNRFGGLGKISNPLKRGISQAFYQFDAYQLAKYNRDGPVKLKDMLRVCHPKPKSPEQAEMWKHLLEGTLPSPQTWEVALSTKGASKETWEGIIPKMGYMALIRNLRNFIEKGVDINPILKKLTDPNEVKRSKQMPFRFLSAYKALEGNEDIRKSQKVLDAMQTALELSIDNLPRLEGTTFMSADNSGSMDTVLSGKGTVHLHEIANLFQSMALKICDESITSVFGERFAVVRASKADGIITNMQKFRNTDVDHSTNAWLAVKWLNDRKEKVDRIIIFSDMQCYSTHGSGGWLPGLRMGYGDGGQSLAEQFEAYKKNVNSKCKLYSIDLAGCGTSQFPMNDGSVVLLAGFSEKLLEFINRYEANKETAISTIMKLKPKEPRAPKPVKESDDDEQA